ncbi:hypothetical protein BDB01DRAFT_795332 [Pilobolus umbonatus]|nr:hypothetical protein BDB01DRAFT_795332 [Pilobolus umbonatus]
MVKSHRTTELVQTQEPNTIDITVNKANDTDILTWSELKENSSDRQDIREIVRRLPQNNILPLLNELLSLLDVQQTRSTELVAWLKTLLLTHTSYFMSLPKEVQRLSGLFNELENHLTVYPKLLSMSGKLNLIQTQIDARYHRDTEDTMDNVSDESNDEQEAQDDELSSDTENDEDEDMLDMDEEMELFAEEEDDLNTEDEDDNISDSDIEE